jgi:hypothetical protein
MNFLKITEMTNNNYHCEALIEGAKQLNLPKLVKKFQLISELHKIDGHLHYDLSKYRNVAYKELLKIAEETLTAEEFSEFYSYICTWG